MGVPKVRPWVSKKFTLNNNNLFLKYRNLIMIAIEIWCLQKFTHLKKNYIEEIVDPHYVPLKNLPRKTSSQFFPIYHRTWLEQFCSTVKGVTFNFPLEILNVDQKYKLLDNSSNKKWAYEPLKKRSN